MNKPMTDEQFWLGVSATKFEDPKKPRKKPPKYKLPEGVKERYESAHEQWSKVRFPNVYKDGHYCKPNIPDYQTANGLTTWICEYLTWTGQHGNRINVMYREINGKKVASTTQKGTSDVDAIINGYPVKLEIKISDKQSDSQKLYESQIKRAGGHYYIVRNPMEFFAVFDKFISAPKPHLFD